jgi:hypothetical protein
MSRQKLVEMYKLKYTILISILLLLSDSIQSQSVNELLSDLQAEVTNYSEERCLIYEVYRCDWIMDSTLVVPCTYPNTDTIKHLFNTLASKVDTSDLHLVKATYDHFITDFEKNRKDYFKVYDFDCRTLGEEIRVFLSFEWMIKYLELRLNRASPREMYETILNCGKKVAASENLRYGNKERGSYIDEIKFSYYYNKLIEISSIHTYYCGSYIYQFELFDIDYYPLVVEDFLSLNLCDTNMSNPDYFKARFNYKSKYERDILTSRKNKEVESVLIDDFECIVSNNSLRLHLDYVMRNDADSLATMIAQYYIFGFEGIDKEPVSPRYFISRQFLSKDRYLPIYIKKVAKLAETDLPAAMKFLNYLDAEKRIKAKEYIKTEIPKDAALYRSLNRNDPFHKSKN